MRDRALAPIPCPAPTQPRRARAPILQATSLRTMTATTWTWVARRSTGRERRGRRAMAAAGSARMQEAQVQPAWLGGRTAACHLCLRPQTPNGRSQPSTVPCTARGVCWPCRWPCQAGQERAGQGRKGQGAHAADVCQGSRSATNGVHAPQPQPGCLPSLQRQTLAWLHSGIAGSHPMLTPPASGFGLRSVPRLQRGRRPPPLAPPTSPRTPCWRTS